MTARRRNLPAYLLLGGWSVVCLFPVYWLAVTSLKGEDAIVGGPRYLPFLDFEPSLQAWRDVLADPVRDVAGRYLNSTVVGVGATLVTLVVGGVAVYGLTRFRYAVRWPAALAACLAAGLGTMALFADLRGIALAGVAAVLLLVVIARRFPYGPVVGNAGMMVAMLATRILPPIVVVLPVYVAAQKLGLLDTRFVLILTYAAVNLPVAAWLLRALFGARTTDAEEAAQLDGASTQRIFWEIFLPTVARGVAAVGLLIFALCWSEYLFAVYLTSTDAGTLPPLLVGERSTGEAQAGGEQIEWARMSAVATLALLPPLLCAVVGFALLGSRLRPRPVGGGAQG